MRTPQSNLRPTANQLLAALPDRERAALLSRGEPVSLAFKQPLSAPDAPIPHVYFPLNAVISLLVVMEDGQAIEVATVGNEGMVGLPLFLGAPLATGHALCQIPGEALRLTAEAFQQALVERDGPLFRLLLRYTQALLVQTAQGAACNQLHPLDARLCRWLVMSHDRAARDTFPLTQEFMAQMLGIRRAGVSEVASDLQRQGLIRYHRGSMSIVDRPGLERCACACYRVIRAEYERMVP